MLAFLTPASLPASRPFVPKFSWSCPFAARSGHSPATSSSAARGATTGGHVEHTAPESAKGVTALARTMASRRSVFLTRGTTPDDLSAPLYFTFPCQRWWRPNVQISWSTGDPPRLLMPAFGVVLRDTREFPQLARSATPKLAIINSTHVRFVSAACVGFFTTWEFDPGVVRVCGS